MKQIQFKGNGSEYFKIWIVNILLCIVTLGIYYPWAKVRTRRYFYANTEYADRYFDYHATGKQLFLGYLIGVGILIVLQIIANVFPLLGMILPLIILAILPWIVWRSLKFNMRMTSFSNVRFSFIGDLKTAYMVHFLIPILGYGLSMFLLLGGLVLLVNDISATSTVSSSTIILLIVALVASIGLAVYITGLFTKKASEYQIGHTKFGQGRFIINVGTREFINIALKTALINIGFLVVALTAFGFIFSSAMGGFDLNSMPNESDIESISPIVSVAGIIIYLSFIAVTLFAASYAFSRKRKYLFANTTLDQAINFKSTVSAKGYFSVLITNMLLTVFTFGLALPWAKVRVANYVADNTWIEAKNVDIDSYITQKEKEQSAIGEEIGDVLDIDVDIAI